MAQLLRQRGPRRPAFRTSTVAMSSANNYVQRVLSIVSPRGGANIAYAGGSPGSECQGAPPSSRGRRALNAAWIISGLGTATVFFILSLALPDRFRGLTCCDSNMYLQMSTPDLSTIFFSSSGRSFGYPFFLALFRKSFSSTNSFITAAAVAQLLLHWASSAFLFWSLRRAGLRLPVVALALLLAHPGLASYAAITVTDSLATSLFSIFISLSALLLAGKRRFGAKSALLGVCAGLLLTIRPSLIAQLPLCCAAVLLGLLPDSIRSAAARVASLKKASLFAVLFLVGFLPFYLHLCMNTYRQDREFRLAPARYVAENSFRSVTWAIIYGRIWGIIDQYGVPQWRSTEDRILQTAPCDIPPSAVVSSLVNCYRGNLPALPKHLAHRLVGLFDNRHLNPYAVLATDSMAFVLLRAFSAAGFAGLAVAICLLLSSLLDGTWRSRGFLAFPIAFLAVQVNFHVEQRYIFPIVPLLFLLGAAVPWRSLFLRRWPYAACLALALIAVLYFYAVTTSWDAWDLAHHKLV